MAKIPISLLFAWLQSGHPQKCYGCDDSETTCFDT